MVITEEGERYFAGVFTNSLCGRGSSNLPSGFVAAMGPAAMGFRWFWSTAGSGGLVPHGLAFVGDSLRVTGLFEGTVDFGEGAVSSAMDSRDGFRLTLPISADAE